MSTVQDGDLIMVERSNTVYKETVDNWLKNGANTDLCVVERSNTCYKETFEDLKKRGPYNDSATTKTMTSNAGTPQVTSATTLPTTFYNVGSGDYTGAYRTCDTRVNVYSAGSTVYDYQDRYWTGNLYFGQKNTAGTSWQGDMSIGNIQILQGNGRAYRHYENRLPGGPQDWMFNNSSGAGTGGWYTSYNTMNSSGTPSAPHSGVSWASIGWGSSLRRWNRTDYSGSSYCGAANGTSPYNTAVTSSYNYYHGGGGKILPAHNGSVTQYSTSAYAMVEWSGSSTNDVVWMKTVNQVRVYNGDILRFSYGGGMGQNSSVGTSAAGTFWWYLY